MKHFYGFCRLIILILSLKCWHRTLLLSDVFILYDRQLTCMQDRFWSKVLLLILARVTLEIVISFIIDISLLIMFVFIVDVEGSEIVPVFTTWRSFYLIFFPALFLLRS